MLNPCLLTSGPIAGTLETPPLTALPADSFFCRFVELNHLKNISHFFFLPGMLFKDQDQWWRSPLFLSCQQGHTTPTQPATTTPPRPQPHEGVDIFLMRNRDQNVENVKDHMLVPAALSGEPVHFHRDFLGETLYIRHPEIQRDDAILHTLYGHIQPCARGVFSGLVDKGQVVGSISPVTSPVIPAHLHISCAWINERLPVSTLNWGLMATGADIELIDPLPYLLQQ